MGVSTIRTYSKNSNPKGFLQSSQPCGSNSQFEPVLKNSNQRGSLQSAEPYGSKSQFENGASAPAFEPFAKTKASDPEKGEVETEIDKFHSEDAVTVIKKVVVKTSQTENKKEKPNFNTITTKTANEVLKTEGEEELNTNIENKLKAKNKQATKIKTKNKTTPPT